MLGEAKRPVLADPCCVNKCEGLLDAIRLCVHMSNFSHDHICSTLGIDNGHWTRIMQGRAHFPTNQLTDLMNLAGNYAPLQYLAMKNGFALIDAREERIRELEEQLAKARAA